MIRPEIDEDQEAIRNLIAESFAASEFGHNGEADLVDQLRCNCPNIVSLVAVENETIVGQILFSPVQFLGQSGNINGMGLAPMAVSPKLQRNGIGSRLIRAGLATLEESTWPFVAVLGHPSYYPRLGFHLASKRNVCHGFAGIPQDVFFVKLLDQRFDSQFMHGTILFRQEFGNQSPST